MRTLKACYNGFIIRFFLICRHKDVTCNCYTFIQNKISGETMNYIYEEPKELIERIVEYTHEIKTGGVLSIEVKLEDETNQFLKLMLAQLVEAISPKRLKYNKKFIKYYIKELKCSKNKKYKIKKQLKMIYRAAELLCKDEPYHQIKEELYGFYPNGFIQIGDYIRTTGATSSEILYGEVTYVDGLMVFFSQLNGEKNLVVIKDQVTDNFGRGRKIKHFVKKFLVDKK